MYQFDEGIERRNTNCEKWDAPFVGEDVIPMWIADMDFAVAPAITDRLVCTAKKEAFGYQLLSDDYYRAVCHFMKTHHRYEIEREWICYVPNVVLGLFVAVQTVTEAGDEVLIQTPVYGPFFRVIQESGRILRESRLMNLDGYYSMDLEDLEKKITEKTKAILLCNPHNPSGRVWTEQELEALVRVCARAGLCVISDDIHSDLILEGNTHTMIANICRKYGVLCITCTSPSKAFNLASIHVANCIIEDRAIRERFKGLLRMYHVDECNAFAEEALIGAYEESEEWLKEVNHYIEQNIDYFVNYIGDNLPCLKVKKPEGTYLVWTDFSETGIPAEKLKSELKEKCQVLVDEGEFFGEAGKGYVRFNLACPRKNIEKVLEKLRRFLD